MSSEHTPVGEAAGIISMLANLSLALSTPAPYVGFHACIPTEDVASCGEVRNHTLTLVLLME